MKLLENFRLLIIYLKILYYTNFQISNFHPGLQWSSLTQIIIQKSLQIPRNVAYLALCLQILLLKLMLCCTLYMFGKGTKTRQPPGRDICEELVPHVK